MFVLEVKSLGHSYDCNTIIKTQIYYIKHFLYKKNLKYVVNINFYYQFI